MKNSHVPFPEISSKIKRVNIGLARYQFFHSPSMIEKNDSRFVGRDQVIDRLKNILSNSETHTGAYLVTGYRGMGKSSYVCKVISLITGKNTKTIRWIFGYILLFLVPYLIFLPSGNPLKLLDFLNSLRLPGFFTFPRNAIEWSLTITFATMLVHFILFTPLIIRHIGCFLIILTKKKGIKAVKNLLCSIFGKYKSFFLHFWSNIKEDYYKRKRVVLNLNLGHEILNEKDILSLIAKNVETEYRKFSYSLKKQILFYSFKVVVLLFLAYQVIETYPVPDRFYRKYLPTQTQSFQSLHHYSEAVYLELINQIKKDTLNIPPGKRLFTQKIEIENGSVKVEKGRVPLFPEYLKHAAKKLVNTTDVYLDWGCCYVSYRTKELVPDFIRDHFNFNFPVHLNYLFLFTFFLLNFLITWFVQFIFGGNHTQYTSRKILSRKLRQLNENIDATVRTELSSGMTINETTFGLNFNRRRAKEYPLAGVRQIEKSLIDIFNDIQNVPFPLLGPEFIIVFDELDKIDPHTNININEKEEELTDFNHSASGFSGGAATRQRKQNVLRLLANMKYFITTAKVKFVFIAGRELYDAFLADVSDREFSISSIFHEVLYIESFLSDESDHNRSDITSMIEHYVCQFLMPEWYILYQTCLKMGNRYEALTIKAFEAYLREETKASDLEIKKAVMQLYQFVHYLTHVSNGAPKKITNLFERHIVSLKSTTSSDVFIRSRNSKFYLSFSYLDQCKIGFIHYLANPIMLSVVNNVRAYGDKLLVSASFLIDHIYKFHRNGFSWRNLEHAPEILDINKTPELRNFINIIISYLNQTHISPVISGLYMFKFPKKISEEISFISKMSEEASAIFNFTLDESLTVKRYYSKLLCHYTLEYHDERKKKNLKKSEFIHTIADIHHILGDLHLADEEYTEAIFEYKSCIQYISHDFKNLNDSHQVTHLPFIVRIMLKLGLVYEKRKTFNSAYLIYSELVSNVIDFRYLDETNFGLEYRTVKGEGWIGRKAVLYSQEADNNKKDDNDKKNDTDAFRKETMPKRLPDDEEKNMIFSVSGDELIPAFAQFITPLKNKLITRLSLFEDIRLMYQAILAKLFVLEKHPLGGISQANLKVAEGEFLNLHLTTNLEHKFLISADFFKKLGDILFYKNGLINNESHYLFNGLYFWDYDVENDIDEYAGENASLKKELLMIKKFNFPDLSEDIKKRENENEKTFIFGFRSTIYEYFLDSRNYESTDSGLKKGYPFQLMAFFSPLNPRADEGCVLPGMTWKIMKKEDDCNSRRYSLLREKKVTPCYACKYYTRSLRILANNLLKQNVNDSPASKALIFLKALDEPEKFYSFRSNFSQILASTLGGFGDILVSCTSKTDHIRENFLYSFFKYLSSNNKTNKFHILDLQIKQMDLSHLEKALLYYLASAKYYKRSSNLKEAHVIYKKILLLLIQYVISNPARKQVIKAHLDHVSAQIVWRIIQCIYSAYEQVHAIEIQKLKWTCTKEMYELLDLNQLSLFPEIEETLYASYELELLCDRIPVLPGTDHVQPRNKKISILDLYHLQAISPYRLNSSIYNRLLSLRFKVLLNREIFRNIMDGYQFDMAYDPQHPILFYSRLGQTMVSLKTSNELTPLKQFLLSFTGQPHGKQNSDKEYAATFLAVLEHLVIDSIFCLQKFIEIIYPHNKTTLFTCSFTANVYLQLFEWTQLFDFLFMLYAYMDDQYKNNTGKKENIKARLTSHCLKRYKANYNLSPDEKVANEEFLYHVFSFDNDDMEIPQPDLSEIIDKLRDAGMIRFHHVRHLFQKRAKKFYEKLYHTIGKINVQMNDGNYLAEMAIKKYQQALATHREGKPYKNMIDDMYYLNDDLDNDTYKFFLALERYRINIDEVKTAMSNLKNVYRNSTLYEIDNYVKHD